MKTTQGNLIHLAKAGHFDVIGHGCNCFCTMSKGIALRIKREFLEAYAIDCDTKHGEGFLFSTWRMPMRRSAS